MRYYRYLVTDKTGSYAILSHGPAEPPQSDAIEVRLLEVTEDFAAAHKAHKALEERLVHVEDRNTRAIVAAMLLSGSSLGPFAKQ